MNPPSKPIIPNVFMREHILNIIVQAIFPTSYRYYLHAISLKTSLHDNRPSLIIGQGFYDVRLVYIWKEILKNPIYHAMHDSKQKE